MGLAERVVRIIRDSLQTEDLDDSDITHGEVDLLLERSRKGRENLRSMLDLYKASKGREDYLDKIQ